MIPPISCRAIREALASKSRTWPAISASDSREPSRTDRRRQCRRFADRIWALDTLYLWIRKGAGSCEGA